MDLDLGKVVETLNSGTPATPAPGAEVHPSQEEKPVAPQGAAAEIPESGGAPAKPSEEAPPVAEPITSKSIVKEGDEFVYRGPEIKDEDGNVISQTIYRGSTVDDVIDQMAKGKSEADLAISRLRKGKLIKAVNRVRTHKVADDEAEDEPGQIDDADIPATAPDMRGIQERILREEIRDSGVDPKLLSYKKEDWRALAETGEVPMFEIMELKSQVNDVLTKTRERATAEYQQLSTVHGNAILVRGESTQLAEYIVEQGLAISEEDFTDILDEHLAKRSSYDKNGVLIPGKIFRATLKQIHEVAKKNTAGKPATPAAPAAKPVGEAARQSVAPGVRSSKTGAPAGAPSRPQPRNLQESEKDALAFLTSQQKK